MLWLITGMMRTMNDDTAGTGVSGLPLNGGKEIIKVPLKRWP